MKKISSAIGARVRYCGHDGWFIADIVLVEDAVVIRANGPIKPENIIRTELNQCTHHVSDFPTGGFWRPDIGVLVVPMRQVRRLS